MIGWLAGLVRVVHAPEGPLPLALFRIGVAVAVLYAVASVAFEGLLGVIWVDAAHGGYRSFHRLPWLVEALGGATPGVMWGLAIAIFVAGTALLLGVGGRATALIVAQLYLAVDVNGHAGGSYDLMIRNALWLCVLAPTTATWSIDAWIWRGRPWRGRPVPVWGRFLVAFQLVLIYWTTGLQKVSAHWVPGGEFSALYFILQQPSWQLYDMSWAAWMYPWTQLATGLTWIWEVTCPLWLVALFARRADPPRGLVGAWFNSVLSDTRTLYALVGLFFHVSLIFTLNVGPFPLISFAFYAAFWTDAEWRSLAGAVTRRLGQVGRTTPDPAAAAG